MPLPSNHNMQPIELQGHAFGMWINPVFHNNHNIKKALDGMRKMSDDDLIMLIGFISRLNTEN